MTIEYLADRLELLPLVARWLHEEWGNLRVGDTVDSRAERIKNWCRRQEIPSAFVATEGGDLLGCASIVQCDMDTRSQLSPWLAGLFVPPERRSQGIGAALVMRVVEEARALEHPTIYLYTTGTGALYLRLGWSIIERTLYPQLWGQQPVMVMERSTRGTVGAAEGGR